MNLFLLICLRYIHRLMRLEWLPREIIGREEAAYLEVLRNEI